MEVQKNSLNVNENILEIGQTVVILIEIWMLIEIWLVEAILRRFWKKMRNLLGIGGKIIVLYYSK